MSACICSSCKNLKSIMDEKEGITESCEFGFPSENCTECEVDSCELTCDHYTAECEEEKFMMAKCSKCGEELKVTSNSQEDGVVYCLNCYLNK